MSTTTTAAVKNPSETRNEGPGRRSATKPTIVFRDPARILQIHLLKGIARTVSLVTTDVLAVLAGRELLRMTRAGGWGLGLADLLHGLLPAAAINASQLAVALVLMMTFLGGYRRGDSWRDPGQVLTAVGGGVLLSIFSSLWTEFPTIVLARGLVIWVSLGVTLVLARQILYLLSRLVPRLVMEHRVLQIQGENGSAGPVVLGSAFKTIAVLHGKDLPEDMEAMDGWLEGGVDTIVVSGHIDHGRFGNVTDFALTNGCRLLCLPRSTELVGVDPRRVWFNGISLLELTAPGLRASQLIMKRAIDILVAAVLLLLFSPLFLILAILVRLDSPGPVLFKHRRAGYRGRFFDLLKFRSMRADAHDLLHADPEMWKRYCENDFKLPEDEDPRITRLGRFLRRSSLDELPQLLNVLKGDMSLVGPRPVVEPELEMYRGRIPTLLSIKPGITGLWQISGRSDIGFPERTELDLEYVRHWSLLGDIWILLITVPAVLLQKGAH